MSSLGLNELINLAGISWGLQRSHWPTAHQKYIKLIPLTALWVASWLGIYPINILRLLLCFNMMMSWHGKTFCITGPLWGEAISHCLKSLITWPFPQQLVQNNSKEIIQDPHYVMDSPQKGPVMWKASPWDTLESSYCTISGKFVSDKVMNMKSFPSW